MSYLDDSSVHEQMVRFATLQLRSGHLPLTSWFPFLGLGSPQFLHYQSLPAMLTGLIGLAMGPDAAFRWTLYLLLSLWPLSVYLAARLFGTDRWAAGASAAMSPFLVSATGIGYEQHAYVWVGFGVWTQLWASLTLPLAWGFSWRAIREGRNVFAAVALVSLTHRAAFRDRIPGSAPAAPVAAGRGRADHHAAAPCRGDRRRFAARRCVGDRAVDRAARVGRDERDPSWDRAGQRLRGRPRARLARLRPAARSWTPAGRDAVRRGRPGACAALAAGRMPMRARWWSCLRRACCCRSAGPRSERWST